MVWALDIDNEENRPVTPADAQLFVDTLIKDVGFKKLVFDTCEAAIADKFGGYLPGSSAKTPSLTIIRLREELGTAPPAK